MVLAGCAGAPVPDGEWDVTLVGTAVSGCVDGVEYRQINERYTYQIFASGSAVDLAIDGQSFATGQYDDGCHISYTSPAYLDSYQGSSVQWQITGTATVDGPAGGCVADETLDWDGTEQVTVVRSDASELPEGCTYDITVAGTLVSGS